MTTTGRRLSSGTNRKLVFQRNSINKFEFKISDILFLQALLDIDLLKNFMIKIKEMPSGILSTQKNCSSNNYISLFMKTKISKQNFLYKNIKLDHIFFFEFLKLEYSNIDYFYQFVFNYL